jgi:ferredoxin--NADP+ reductase
MIQKKDRQPANSELKEYTLSNNLEISPGVHLISFLRDFDFLPGQVVKIAVDKTHPPRIYSICSGNKSDEVSVLFNIKEDGYLTPKMAAMIPGDKILVSQPYGSFTGTKGKAWLIATGTGIAPFYSTIMSGLAKGKTLIHGVRFLNQFYFEDELEETLGENYIRCCSAETSCNVYPGRVTDYLNQLESLPNEKYYLCGQALMVVEVRDLLIKKGIGFENIMSEIFF